MTTRTTSKKVQYLVIAELCANRNTTSIVNAESSSSKREVNLIAALALRGVAVHRLADGGYLACQWTFTRHCRDLDELTVFARQTGITP